MNWMDAWLTENQILLPWAWLTAAALLGALTRPKIRRGWLRYPRVLRRTAWSVAAVPLLWTTADIVSYPAALVTTVTGILLLTLYWALGFVPSYPWFWWRWLQAGSRGQHLEILNKLEAGFPQRSTADRFYHSVIGAICSLRKGEPAAALRYLQRIRAPELLPWELRIFAALYARVLLVNGWAAGTEPMPVRGPLAPAEAVWLRGQRLYLQGKAHDAEEYARHAAVEIREESEEAPEPTSGLWRLYQLMAQWAIHRADYQLAGAHCQQALALADPRVGTHNIGDLYHAWFSVSLAAGGDETLDIIKRWQQWLATQPASLAAQVQLFVAALGSGREQAPGLDDIGGWDQSLRQQCGQQLLLWYQIRVGQAAAVGGLDPDYWLTKWLSCMGQLRRAPLLDRYRGYRCIYDLLQWYQGGPHDFSESLEQPTQLYMQNQALDQLAHVVSTLPMEATAVKSWCLRQRLWVRRTCKGQPYSLTDAYADLRDLQQTLQAAARDHDAWQVNIDMLEEAVERLDDAQARRWLAEIDSSWQQWAKHPAMVGDHLRLAYCATRLDQMGMARKHWRHYQAAQAGALSESRWSREYASVVEAYLRARRP